MPDHVHLLVKLKADLAVAEAVRLVKSNSSGWVNENQKIRGRFEWQTGYFAVSVSESRVDEVRRYIRVQKKHHARISFQDELVRLLKKHRIAFDEKYLLGRPPVLWRSLWIPGWPAASLLPAGDRRPSGGRGGG